MASYPQFEPRISVHTDELADGNRMWIASLFDYDNTVEGIAPTHSGATHAAGAITITFRAVTP